MNKKFDVYKWRRDNLLTEDVSNSTRADYVYNAIKEYLSPNYQDPASANSIKRQIMYGLMDADKATPLQEGELKGSWVDKKGTFDGKEYDGYFKTTFSKQESKVKDAMKDKEYTYVGFEEIDFDEERKTEYWYYFKK